jgi:UrcA family protein
MIALLLLPTASFASSSPAAARVEDLRTATVRYDDLNLNTARGIAGLYGRIHAAAVDVCQPLEDPQLADDVFWSDRNECIAHAVAKAVQDVHNEKLSAYHFERIRGWKVRSLN